ncbi:predicted protein [Naegleria gruberi]|uniref:Predicted protein n=1 Tax=Naegleria gruberi TaxID=5762 RepID=D2V8I1_NAEGR|nr:uncharacterized protein NAEGRDRAFT_65164 [Naegleria gruberi]EFC46812.1 predicted protein [Naegleria gruberi]|eukprot:XP_002679556.1 predicted protein [Naegleria gruberi strain NEG-M]
MMDSILPPIPISLYDFFGSIWIIPGTIGSIIGDPLVCYLAYILSPKVKNQDASGPVRIRWPIVTFMLQIIFGLIRTGLFFLLVFWTRYYCLEHNVRGVFNGFIPEDDDADEDEINKRMYENSANAAFGFIKMHFFIMNFASSYIGHVISSAKTGYVANPMADQMADQPNNAIPPEMMKLDLNLICHAASVVIYVYIVLIFVWSVIGLSTALMVAVVHIALILVIYRNVVKMIINTVKKLFSNKTD